MNIETFPILHAPVDELRAELVQAMNANEVGNSNVIGNPPFPQDFVELIANATNRGSFDIDRLQHPLRNSSRKNFVKTLKVDQGLVGVHGQYPILIYFLRQNSKVIRASKFVKFPEGWKNVPSISFDKKGFQMSYLTNEPENEDLFEFMARFVGEVLQMLADNLRTRTNPNGTNSPD
jgi:hypothetical protein